MPQTQKKKKQFRKNVVLQRRNSIKLDEFEDIIDENIEAKRFEDWDLKNTRNLKKYDCWTDSISPDKWVEKCQTELGVGVVHC
jgi:hypothetical protein